MFIVYPFLFLVTSFYHEHGRLLKQSPYTFRYEQSHFNSQNWMWKLQITVLICNPFQWPHYQRQQQFKPPGEFWRPAVKQWVDVCSLIPLAPYPPLLTRGSSTLSLHPFYLLPLLKFLVLQKYLRKKDGRRGCKAFYLYYAVCWFLLAFECLLSSYEIFLRVL